MCVKIEKKRIYIEPNTRNNTEKAKKSKNEKKMKKR
jgi:hypothetical protein